MKFVAYFLHREGTPSVEFTWRPAVIGNPKKVSYKTERSAAE